VRRGPRPTGRRVGRDGAARRSGRVAGLRVLHAIHDFLPRHQAGSEIYVHELCRAQAAEGLGVHVLCAEYDPGRPHGSLVWRVQDGIGVTEVVNNWAFASFEETYRSRELGRQLAHVLRAIQPDVLHVHNLLNLSFDLPAMARALGVPSVATLHDYTLVCPSGGQRVHQAERHVCRVIDPDRCRRCFPQHVFASQLAAGRLIGWSGPGVARPLLGLAATVARRFPALAGALRRRIDPVRGEALGREAIVARLARVGEVFAAVDLFVAPSPSLAAEYHRLGLPDNKLRVSDYGFVPMAPVSRTPADGRLRIGFVGTLTWHKGAHVLVEAARRLPRDRFEVKLFGDPATFPDYVATLREAARDLPVRFLGRFDRADVAGVYGEIDVLVVPSLWPENSPLVIHEAFMAGIPVVGARQGGIPDLVTHDRNGLLYEAFAPAELAAALARLIEEPGTVERLGRAHPPVKTIAEDAREWAARYAEVRALPRPSGRASV
jgi:glycosyltransferase involved in cell wall biosynthesis